MEDRTQEIQGMFPRAIGLLSAVPSFIKLVYALFADARVPKYLKILTAGAVVYVGMPFDFLPDFVPTAGMADDLLVILLLLVQYIKACPREVFEEHWNNIMGSAFDIEKSAERTMKELEPLVGEKYGYLKEMIFGATAKIAAATAAKTAPEPESESAPE